MKASDFAALVPGSCSEVLDTMYFTTVLAVTQTEGKVQAEQTECSVEAVAADTTLQPEALFFSLRFAGDISGRFGLHTDAAVARTLASNFLGEEESGVSVTEVGEVVGELTNMLCGSVMSRVKTTRTFSLSHPEPIAALPNPATADMLVSRFDTDAGAITTWLIVDGDQCPS